MAFGLTPLGVVIKTLAIIKTEQEAAYRAAYGDGIPLGPDTEFGKDIGISSEREALLWELIQAIVDAFDPDKATEIALDRVVRIIGILRSKTTRSTDTIHAAGIAATTILAGSLFEVQDTAVQFRSLSDTDLGTIEIIALTSLTRTTTVATAATGAAHGLSTDDLVFIDNAAISQIETVTVDTATNDFAYTVTINGTDFTITSDSSATKEEIRDALIAEINGGAEPVTAAPGVGTDDLTITADVAGVSFTVAVSIELSSVSDQANVAAADSDFNGLKRITDVPTTTTFEYTVDVATVTPAEGGIQLEGTTPILLESVDLGAVEAPSGSLTIIVNGITGLTRVENELDAVKGQGVEEDPELRERRDDSLAFSGGTTIPSLRAKLRNISGVTEANVFDNDTDFVDADGLDPHTYECVVDGGDDTEIAQVIFDNKPLGITPFSAAVPPFKITEIILDEEGNPKTIEFSRPEDIEEFVEVDYTLNPEAIFPADGEQLMEDAVLAQGNQLSIGEDVIIDDFEAAVTLSTTGIATRVVRIDEVSPVVPSVNIPITKRQRAKFDSSRVTITLV